MFQKFSSDKLKTLIAVSDSDQATLIKNSLHHKIGGTYEMVANLDDALEKLKTNHIDWVISEGHLNKSENILAFLKRLTEDAGQKSTRVSLISSAADNYIIPTAFELGLMSYHDVPKSEELFSEAIDELVKTAEICDFQPTLVSAVYIRQILRESNRTKEWLQMEKELLSLFPGNTELFLFLAEAQFLNKMKVECINTLKQVIHLDAKVADRATSMLKSYFPDEDMSSDLTPINVLGLKKVLIVDADPDIVKATKSSLERLGAGEIFEAKDGEEAIAHIEANKDLDLIIQEWKLQKLTGSALLQRIKFELNLNCPIIVHSSLLRNEDEILVQELGVALVIEKPFNSEIFNKSIVSVIQQDRFPTKASALEMKFQNYILVGNVEKAKEIATQFLTTEEVSESKKLAVKAQLSYSLQNYPAAKALALEAIKLTGDTILLLNLLGKVLMRLNDYSTAIRCFEKADRLSPGNMDRICAIVESYSATGEYDLAEAKIEDSSDIDRGSRLVKETRVKVAFDKGDTEASKSLMLLVHPMESLISFMNNKAVALAKNDRLMESIEEYRKAAKSIPDSRQDLVAIIKYNLALAFARNGEMEQAHETLENVVRFEHSKVFRKSKSLLARLRKAMENGSNLELIAREASSFRPNEELIDDVYINEKIASEIKRGDLCCYMIFNNEETKDQRIHQLLKSTIVKAS